MKKKSLKKQHNELADTKRQLEILSNGIFGDDELPTFAKKIEESHQFPLRPKTLEVLQINLGYMCNQVCEQRRMPVHPNRRYTLVFMLAMRISSRRHGADPVFRIVTVARVLLASQFVQDAATLVTSPDAILRQFDQSVLVVHRIDSHVTN